MFPKILLILSGAFVLIEGWISGEIESGREIPVGKGANALQDLNARLRKRVITPLEKAMRAGRTSMRPTLKRQPCQMSGFDA